MSSTDEAEAIAENKTVLCVGSRKAGREADGTENIQTGEVVVSAHFAFGNTNVRPAEWNLGFRAGPRADISDSRFVKPSAAERMRVGKREYPEGGIAGTRKTRNVAYRIQAIPGKCDGLIIICQEEPDLDFTVLPGEIVNICGELVFAEMAWFREH